MTAGVLTGGALGEMANFDELKPGEAPAGWTATQTGGGTANGTLVDLYSCNGTGAQVWQPQSNGSLLNPQSGKCLDDTGWSTTPGTQVQIWSCTGGANQAWTRP